MTTGPLKQPDARPGLWWGLGAALLSAVGAGLCCAAPLVYLLFGVSLAGLSRLGTLSWLQWPLGAVALIILVWVFSRLYLSKRPLCTGGVNRYIHWFFWVTVLVVLALLTYPYFLVWWL